MRSLSPVCTVGDTSRLSLLLICSFRLLSSSCEAISCSLVLWYWEACVSSCFLTSISCIYDAKKHQREMNETKYQTGENKRERAKEMWPLRLDCVPAGAFCSTSFSSLFWSRATSRSCFSIWAVSRCLVSVSERSRVAWKIYLQIY